MGKLFRFLDNNIVKIGVAFLLFFIALYPKVPSVHIIRTYVYIRLEDFFIAAVVIVWFVQLIRRKVSLPPLLLSLPIYLYWFVGFLCLGFCLLVFGPKTPNFFPHIAALEYLRRIEYMILFFVAWSTIKSKKDIKDYFVVLVITVILVAFYGIGQKFYGVLWYHFPWTKIANICFPSFQTGNEEFAKGYELCLPSDGRITSTFAGSYDLSAYMVFVIPLFVTVLLTLKKWKIRIAVGSAALLALLMLIFTASRVSFISYLVGISAALIFYKRKLALIPVLLVSIILLFVFSSSTIKRFEQTIRYTAVVTTGQGEIIGELSTLTNGQKVIKGNVPSQALPEGSVVIGLPSKSVSTSSATVRQNLSPEQARALRLQNGGYQLSTINGSFLIQKALTLDISFTTRFQAEWPRAWNAFLRDPFLGTGYSTLTLATDGDYLRFLGESGFLGLVSFFSIFLIFGIALSKVYPSVTSPFHKALFMGAAGGLVGIFVNAIFIDVFEASKVAESLWIILGITIGTLFLYQKETIPYVAKVKSVLVSTPFVAVYLLVAAFIVYINSLSNFFVADDFTWLHWVANATFSDVATFFTNATNFFYRPLDKTAMFFLYTLFSFNPQGYHLFILLLHYLATLAVFMLTRKIFKSKLLAFVAAALFLLIPSQAENIYWISTISTTFASMFILYGLVCAYNFAEKRTWLSYCLTFLFGILAFLSYEIATVYPFLVTLIALYIDKFHFSWKKFEAYLPFFMLLPIYYIVRYVTHAFSGGGDYSYNYIHFIPNAIGNFIGYFGLFIFGENFLSFYIPLRASLRTQVIPVMIIVTLVVIIGLFAIFTYRKQLINYIHSNGGSLIFFSILFSIIALMPFLGLGNISERYGYLAVVGFSILVVLVFQKISSFLPKTSRSISILILLGIVSLFYYYSLQKVNHEWEYAGTITKDTLTEFRLDYSTLTPSANVYFINLPIKYQNAWVFPLGVKDAMWFIYRDNEPTFYQVNSLDAAKQQTNFFYNNTYSNNYIFAFDKHEYIYKVK